MFNNTNYQNTNKYKNKDFSYIDEGEKSSLLDRAGNKINKTLFNVFLITFENELNKLDKLDNTNKTFYNKYYNILSLFYKVLNKSVSKTKDSYNKLSLKIKS